VTKSRAGIVKHAVHKIKKKPVEKAATNKTKIPVLIKESKSGSSSVTVLQIY
jgi:hypothetical protein